MRTLTSVFLIAALAILAACGTPSKFRTYNGPEVTRIIVDKGDRQMRLMHHGRVLRTYQIELGFVPNGHKAFEGDGRTPEGEYFIDRRNPNSSFHLSLGISYPNGTDIEVARAAGMDPGGDIFIHGQPNALAMFTPDWTAGCIAVSNREMEDIYAMVKDGTPITINP